MASVSAVSATFAASIKSVGTAVTMSGVGFYLHHRQFISKEGKRSLALMSQQVTFPLYFFTKIIYCNQDWSDQPCPDVTSTLHDTWMLLFWPCYMVGMGLLVGHFVARWTGTPKHQVPSVLAAVAFANNTALPITLLAVVHANFPSTSDLGRIDPTLFLSVYLVVYPILQWSLGGWILAPSDEESDEIDNKTLFSVTGGTSLGESLGRVIIAIQHTSHQPYYNVVNNKTMVRARNDRTHGLTSADEGCYMTELDLKKLDVSSHHNAALQPLQALPSPGFYDPLPPNQHRSPSSSAEENYPLLEGNIQRRSSSSSSDENYPLIEDGEEEDDDEEAPFHTFNKLKASTSFKGELDNIKQCTDPITTTATPMSPVKEQPKARKNKNYSTMDGLPPKAPVAINVSPPPQQVPPPYLLNNSVKSQRTIATIYGTDTIWETIRNILDRTLFQPPVIGALLGILCAVTPARGVFVDLVNRHSGAPLQWLFDGLYKIGSLAVPDNMLILGCNLSASYTSFVDRKRQTMESNKKKRKLLQDDCEVAEHGGKVSNSHQLTRRTMIGIVVGKMIVMPFIGITTTFLLERYVLDIPDEIAGAFYLVLMIVFITPTANNVMIMIELSGCDMEVLEGVANVIALQYMVAPIILSFTMTVAIGVASGWS